MLASFKNNSKTDYEKPKTKRLVFTSKLEIIFLTIKI